MLVPGASGLKHVIEPNSGKVFAGLQPESLTAVPMQLCVRYYSAGNSAYYNLAYHNLAYHNSACGNSVCNNLACYKLAYYNLA